MSSDLWMMHCARTRGLFARWLCRLPTISDFKRPKYEVNLSYIVDGVSKRVRNSTALLSQGSVALICELLDVCTLINSY